MIDLSVPAGMLAASNPRLRNVLEDLGIDYVEKRNAEIDAVTMADVKRVAKRMFENQDLIVTIVGKPKGLAATPAKRS